MRENENIANVRRLRRQQTDAEKRLWYFLRDRRFQGLKFRRQYAVGVYICDFVCVEAKLVIELDGGQHVTQQAYDKKRTNFLQSQDFTVLRFWNDDVLKAPEIVLERVMLHLRIPSPQPSPVNGRGGMLLSVNL